MLIIGAYPDGFDVSPVTDDSSTPLERLSRMLVATFSENVGLHLLPFYPSSGDSGFAIDDWFQVRPDLGSWKDISELAGQRKLIVDGVYNHVGIGHQWVREFRASPWKEPPRLHAYNVANAMAGPLSPRGRAVLRPYEILGETWHLWQTFTDAGVDIRLDQSEVLDAIDEHLQLLRSVGVWGVRLDAVAYYAKAPGSGIRHNPGVHKIADTLAAMVERLNMQVLAQLDCDVDHQDYFNSPAQSHVVVNDFSYSSFLAIAITLGDARPLAKHLAATSQIPKLCLRTPRGHDGILFRSKLLDTSSRERLSEFCRANGISVRSENGSPYEINCSAPFLYSLTSGRERLADAIELSAAVTGMTSGWAYFYLPYLIGSVPEDRSVASMSGVLRSLNRLPLTFDDLSIYRESGSAFRIRRLLDVLARIHDIQLDGRYGPTTPAFVNDDDVFVISRVGGFELYANFSSTRPVDVRLPLAARVMVSNRHVNGSLLPLGYVLCSTSSGHDL